MNKFKDPKLNKKQAEKNGKSGKDRGMLIQPNIYM